MGDVVPIGKNAPKKVRSSMILTYIHCAMCCEEVPAGVSMQEFALEEVGLTRVGLQVWCRRHNANILHLDFEGFSHPSTEGNDEGCDEF